MTVKNPTGTIVGDFGEESISNHIQTEDENEPPKIVVLKAEKEDKPVDPKQDRCIRVHGGGKLMFVFNPETNCIEVRVQGVTYKMSVDVLKVTAATNWVANTPVQTIEAEKKDSVKDVAG